MGRLVVALALGWSSAGGPEVWAAADREDGGSARAPDIVFILADDLGFGDLGCYHGDSKIPTPQLDRLAAAGVRCTDVHAGASWCTPSRYAFLTGRFPWRCEEGFRSRNGYAGHLIGAGEATVASMLRDAGYATACIGKWHLGLGPKESGPTFEEGVRIPHGPNEIGFGYSHILPASLDMPPYVYVEDQVPTAPLTGRIEDHESAGMRWAAGEFWRGGEAAEGFDFHQVLPHFRDRAVAWIRGRAEARRSGADGRPFFLYFPLTAPHTPWMPVEPFRGTSGAGPYGDFVAQVDSVVGDVLAALESGGLSDNTLVVFSSDNGAFWVDEEKEAFGHLANGPLRGGKMDAWEGGHRVPFLARWPGRIPAGAVSDALFCFTDLMATMAAAAGAGPLPEGTGPDSRDALGVLTGDATGRFAVRRTLALAAGPGYWVRDADLKLITFLGSGGFTPPRRVDPQPGGPTGQLYDLAADPGETTDRFLDRPDDVARLRGILDALRGE